MAKKRVHEFVLRVTFNRKCSEKYALREVKDNIYGEFYPFQDDIDTDPETFRVSAIKQRREK